MNRNKNRFLNEIFPIRIKEFYKLSFRDVERHFVMCETVIEILKAFVSGQSSGYEKASKSEKLLSTSFVVSLSIIIKHHSPNTDPRNDKKKHNHVLLLSFPVRHCTI